MNEFVLPEYHMVVEGLMPPPAKSRFDALRPNFRNLAVVVNVAAAKIWDTRQWSRKNPKPKDWVSAWDYIDAMMPECIIMPDGLNTRQQRRFTNRLWVAVVSLSLDVAKMDTRYWGVTDPAEESYCSYCKSARPIAEFQQSHFTCDPCFTLRKGGSKW